MDTRYGGNPRDVKNWDTSTLRQEFLVGGLFTAGMVCLTYCQGDRLIIGSAVPLAAGLELVDTRATATGHFLQRREIGIINIGGHGTVTTDRGAFTLRSRDGLYAGMGSGRLVFSSTDQADPARFYFAAVPAHAAYPSARICPDDPDFLANDSNISHMGSRGESNERTMHRYIHAHGVKSCQLVMGLTTLAPGSVWNTMPCHIHDRRSETYLYFDMPPDSLVFHLLGRPEETRHIVARNEEAVINPSWSIHSGVGTTSYSFIWAMAGENQAFHDVETVPSQDLR